MSEQQERQPRVKISGLWVGETKDGKKYLSGGNGSVRYSIWPNGFASEGENQPTHILYVEAAKKRDDDSGATKKEKAPF